jgi:alkylation response protein AidB-like acyl-CoA dehydrogenase
MNPLISEDQQLAIDEFRRLLEAEIRPIAVEYRDQYIPREVTVEALRKMSPFGVVGGLVSEEHGGMGLDFLTVGVLFEELARVSADLALTALINIVMSVLLDEQAPDAIRDRYLPGMISGDVVGCMGISEPDVGSNVVEIRTRARHDGDHYVLDGEKTWITNGEFSDFCVVTARTSDEQTGLTHILVDRKDHGYEVQNIHKMGLEGSSTAQLFFSGTRVPVANAIGAEGQGLRNTLTLFEKARVFVALTSVGIAQAALERTIRYSQDRVQHGKKIAGHQLIAGMIAEMATQLDAARLLCHRGLLLLDRGQRCDTETSMAKWYATEVAVEIAGKAVQIHDGNGITKEYWVEKHFRDAKIMPIPDGTTEIQKLLIARNLTGVRAF